MRLVHFSDIHVTIPPHEEALGLLHPKRALGAVNYYAGGRWRHFAGVEERISRLLDDADAQAAQPGDHVLCTGDLTTMSWEEEFARCARLFGARTNDPSRYTVLPGNHDRYTRASLEERRFERHFGAVAAPGKEDVAVKRIGPGVQLVVIDVSLPTLFASRGRAGKHQIAKLKDVLTDRALAGDYVILALHYGLLRPGGGRDWPSHRIEGDLELLEVIDREDAHVDLVVHGHIHRAYAVKTARRTVVCTGSATDLAYACGYNVYDIDADRRTFRAARRTWDRARQTFEESIDDQMLCGGRTDRR